MQRLIEKLEDFWWALERWYTDKFKMFFKRVYWKIRYGFDVSETWNLDYSLCKWLLPRLKYFRKMNFGFPCCDDLDGVEMTMDKWNEYIDAMIFWCEGVAADNEPLYIEGGKGEFGTEKMKERFGLAALGKEAFDVYFHNLWW